MPSKAPITIKLPKQFYPYFLDMVDAYQCSYSTNELTSLPEDEQEFILYLEKEILKGAGTKRLKG